VGPIGNHLPTLLAGLGILFVMVLGMRLPVPHARDIADVLAAHQVVNLSVGELVPRRLDPPVDDSPVDELWGSFEQFLHFRVRELRVSLDFVASLFAM
jgi:hypothetical protein